MNYPYYLIEFKNRLGLTRKERHQDEAHAARREGELADDPDVLTVKTSICDQTDTTVDACTAYSWHTREPR